MASAFQFSRAAGHGVPPRPGERAAERPSARLHSQRPTRRRREHSNLGGGAEQWQRLVGGDEAEVLGGVAGVCAFGRRRATRRGGGSEAPRISRLVRVDRRTFCISVASWYSISTT